MLDLTVHRIRNLSYHPKSILCFATTPSTLEHSFLAISRDNGQIELKSANQKLRTISVVSGYQQKRVNVMAWVISAKEKSEFHLVGASEDGTVFVVDFSKGRLTNIIPSDGGGVLAMTTLQQDSALFAVGCEDGSVKFYSLRQDKTIELLSSIPSSGAAILSLAWRKEGLTGNIDNEEGPSSMVGSTLYVASDDGIIRRYDCFTQPASSAITWRSNMRMTLETRGRSTSTKVWTMKAMSNARLVTGDSLGHVQIWDGSTGTLEQTFVQNDSRADVLSLDVTEDETKIFASGVHSRVVCIERVPEGNESQARWVLSNAQRPHTHDVTSVAVVYRRNATGKLKPILCTGGFDTKLCTYLVKKFPKMRPRTIYPWPVSSPISVATNQRSLMIRREKQVDIYGLADYTQPGVGECIPVPDEDKILGSLAIESDYNVSCAAFSREGDRIAVCDTNAVSLFGLSYKQSGKYRVALPRKIPVDDLRDTVAVHFTPAGVLVAVTSDGRLCYLSNDESTFQESSDRFSVPIFGVSSIVSSDDGAYLAVICEELISSTIFIFRRTDNGYRLWWNMTKLENFRGVASFVLPTSKKTTLALAGLDFELKMFDVESRTVHEWNRKAIEKNRHVLPSEIHTRNDFPVTIASNPAAPTKLLVVCMDLINYKSDPDFILF